MAGFITAFPNSLKVELATGVQNFANGGDQFAIALGVAAPVGTFDATTTNYSDLGSDEVANGSGYATGGFVWTNAQNVTPALGTPDPTTKIAEAFWSWSINPSWAGATFSTSGCVGYNKSKSNRAAYIGSFGGILTVTSNTLTLVLPANAAGTSILALS